MKKYFFILFVTLSYHSMAQMGVIQGNVFNEANRQPFPGVTVSVLSRSDSTLIASVVSDSSGHYSINNIPYGNHLLTITAAGFQQYVSLFRLDSSLQTLADAKMFGQDKNLEGVIIMAKAPPVSINGDTVSYSAGRYKVNPDATAEDLIKKMPGITVEKSGSVTAMGEQVKNVTVDGRKFFGDDATAALRNLPAEIIDKIQVFDRLSEQAQFTGFDDGNGAKGMNIVTKPGNRNGQFGRIYAGYGTNDRYNAGGNMSFFKGNRRISLIGLFNNINQQNFSIEDILGVTGSGGGRMGGGGNRGGGRMGGGFGGGGGAFSNFMVGQQNGINETQSAGINYSDKWSKNTDVTGSYFFNTGKSNNDQASLTRFFMKDSADQIYEENDLVGGLNTNHRFNMRIEQKIDSFNSLIFSPSVSIQTNSSDNLTDGIRFPEGKAPLSSNELTRTSETKGFNTNNDLLFRHGFRKKGRTLSINITIGGSKKQGDIFLNSYNEFSRGPLFTLKDSVIQQTDQHTSGNNYSANLSYTEPVGKNGQIQVSYTPSLSLNQSRQIVYAFDTVSAKYELLDTGLSNEFETRMLTHTAGISYRKGDRDNMITFGVNARITDMNSEQQYPVSAVVQRSFFNLLPNVMWRKKIGTGKSININYRSAANTPSIGQLQNVIDNSNPLLLTTGNPDLKQQVNHTLIFRYNSTNASKGSSFFANMYLQTAQDYIGNSVFMARRDSLLDNGVILPPGAQLTKPVNLDGYMNVRLFLTSAFPLKKIKSNLNLNGGVTWSRLPGLINGVDNRSDNYAVNGGFVLSSNISERVDFTVSYNGVFNSAINSLQPDLNSTFVNHTLGFQCNLLSKKGWFLSNDLSGQYYSGLSQGFNQRYWLWGASAGKKFLKNKMAEIKLSVFDLLNQNQSISRTVTESSIEDVRNTVLRRYLMLTFSYKLRNFGTPSRNFNREGGFPRGGFGPPPGMGSF